MIHLANVLIATADTALAEDLSAKLRRNFYHGQIAGTGAQALAEAREHHPDIVLIGPLLEDMEPAELLSRLASDPQTEDIPTFLMVPDEKAGAVAQRALAAGADDLLRLPGEEAELLARLYPLLRLATMHGELRLRAELAERFGVSAGRRVDGQDKGGKARLLLVGEGVGDLAFPEGYAEITTTANLYEAEDLVARQNFDAALLVAGGRTEAHLDLCSQIRHNPRLFNLPVLLILDGPAKADVAEAYRRGATRVMPRPLDMALLHGAIEMLVRRQRLRWRIREALMQTLTPHSSDAQTGVYSRAFLESYLAARLEKAKTQNRPLSVLYFYIPNVDGVRTQFGEDAAGHLLQQLAQWISSLLRAEDLTAHYQGNEFCVVLPDTPREEAEVVMHRIAGILAYTDFAVRDVFQPVKVWVQAGCADLRAEDDPAALIGRARLNLD